MRIESDEFILRPWEEKDAERLAIIANNRKISYNLRDGFPYPYSIDDAKKFLSNAINEDGNSKLFAIEINGIVAGSIAAYFKDDVHRKNAEIGYFMAEEYWGRGIMPKAVRCLTQYLFDNFDIIRVYALPYARNRPSRRVLEKAGFRLEAVLKSSIFKNDVVQDGCIYSILKDEF